jgi:hypothetical protein
MRFHDDVVWVFNRGLPCLVTLGIACRSAPDPNDVAIVHGLMQQRAACAASTSGTSSACAIYQRDSELFNELVLMRGIQNSGPSYVPTVHTNCWDFGSSISCTTR